MLEETIAQKGLQFFLRKSEAQTTGNVSAIICLIFEVTAVSLSWEFQSFPMNSSANSFADHNKCYGNFLLNWSRFASISTVNIFYLEKNESQRANLSSLYIETSQMYITCSGNYLYNQFPFQKQNPIIKDSKSIKVSYGKGFELKGRELHHQPTQTLHGPM